jgi:ceramide glucosyltransferase
MRLLSGVILTVSAIVFAYAIDPTLVSRLHVPSAAGWLVGAGVVVLALVLRWHHMMSKAVSPYTGNIPTASRYPSVTMVRPVRGKDVGAEDNFRAALDTGYPGEVETLFVFDDDSDPGLPVARAVVAAHRASGRAGTADVIVAGAPPAGVTGKLNAMIAGEKRAKGELIGFGDSDTRPDKNVLRGVVDALMARPRAGSAFAPVLVDQPALAAGDALYALMQNAMYSPLAAHAAGQTRTLPFIMGQLMVFRRQALASIGGVRAAQGQLVDDMAIGRALHEAGWENVMSRKPLHIATGGMTLKEFIPVYRRWMSFSKNGLPLSFTWRQWLAGASFFIALFLSLATLAVAGLRASVPALIALYMTGDSLLLLQKRYGGAAIPARLAWTAWGVFIISPVVLAANMLKQKVEWRGRSYDLAAGATLAALPTPALASEELHVIDGEADEQWPAQHPTAQHQIA